MQPDPESRELLRAIARPADQDQIPRLAASIRNWDALLDLAQEHRVLPILHSRLAAIDPPFPAIPPAALQRLQSEYDRNIFHSLANAAELIAILKAFDAETIPAMPFKGVVLGASAYHNLTTRPAGDLDLLIHHRDLPRAMAILLHRGYEMITEVDAHGKPANPFYYEFRFERPADGMVTELRWRLELIQGKFKRDLGFDWVWSRRRTTTLAGAEVPNMSPEITLLMLCMHGSRHVWSRLIWIHDVAQLLASSPNLDWEQITRDAKKFGLRRTLALGVLLAHQVSGAPVPQPILGSFESDTTATHLAQHIQQNLFEEPFTKSMGRTPYGVQLLDFPDRLRLLFSLDLLRPNERDRAAIPLPKSLHALYYLIRPFRLLRDRSPR